MDQHFRPPPQRAPADGAAERLRLLWRRRPMRSPTPSTSTASPPTSSSPGWSSTASRCAGRMLDATTETGEVFWASPAPTASTPSTSSSTRVPRHPADFIAFATLNHALADGDHVHQLFLANFFAQNKALAFGKTAAEVRAEGTEGSLVAAREFSGDRPTTSITALKLTASVLGQLIALYEHITFARRARSGESLLRPVGRRAGKQLARTSPKPSRATTRRSPRRTPDRRTDPLLPRAPRGLSERAREDLPGGPDAPPGQTEGRPHGGPPFSTSEDLVRPGSRPRGSPCRSAARRS